MDYTPAMGRKPLDKERINISLPKGMPKQMMDAAAALGKDRSDLIADLCREYLRSLEKAQPAKRRSK